MWTHSRQLTCLPQNFTRIKGEVNKFAEEAIEYISALVEAAGEEPTEKGDLEDLRSKFAMGKEMFLRADISNGFPSGKNCSPKSSNVAEQSRLVEISRIVDPSREISRDLDKKPIFLQDANEFCPSRSLADTCKIYFEFEKSTRTQGVECLVRTSIGVKLEVECAPAPAVRHECGEEEIKFVWKRLPRTATR
ncbi:hypothetical protein B0H14DRAFT_2638523 [Mycena olivaceomarginata]|nr:hypothetical protein B0H14DRAFT_2638523 [Mycena olivaceomarginata]